MGTIRRSSHSGGANAASSSSPPTSESQEGSSSPSDNAHQSSDPHEKKDQVLEASDPDLNPTSSSVTVSPKASPAVAEQLDDAVGTPINEDIEEQDPVEGAIDTIQDEYNNEEQEDSPDQDVSVEDPEAEDEEEALRLDKGVSHHVNDSGASAAGSVKGHHRHGEVNHSLGSPAGATKHAKRPAEDHFIDSNTTQDDETQDYLAGAYKSPFRHTHKAEKVGKEER
ncbi:hypothetical protein EMPS_06398 [Entomortierella parvispora]|uniref:Uncharacterized protein n=1 Tax=Entomortierella parvispora TaxID=205924 RepID=A0A9P3HC77_9FUNG|nr:hypothetical protein EMPS_06398 [Entomortierella parvispora]